MGDHGFTEDGAAGGQRKEIYTYKAPWTVFSMSWSRRFVALINIIFVGGARVKLNYMHCTRLGP